MTWGTQRNWRWCSKCQGLWFGPNQALSTCPEGGQHAITGTKTYSLLHSASPTPPNHQASWRWCSRCQGLWFGPNQALSNCPEGGQHSSTASGNYLLPIVTSRVRVHAKVLTSPNVPLETVFQNMREVYATVEIDVEWATTETLNLPALNVVDVGRCFMGETTSEQNQLFGNRNSAGPNDLVVYFVLATNPPSNGCAAHPLGQPGAVVAQIASQWTFAHENGHVLGLRHVDDNNRLMTGNGTANITNPPPDLIPTEGTTMQDSALTVND